MRLFRPIAPQSCAALAVAVLVVAAATGCLELDLVKRRAESPLRPAQMSPDSVVVEAFFARFAEGDPRANSILWREIDEQHFPAEKRRDLARCGFRAGKVGGQVPLALARLLEMKDEAPPDDGVNRVSLDRLQTEPLVTHRRMQVRPGAPSEIVTSRTYDELTVLRCEEDGLCGRTYAKAQALYDLRVYPLHDGRVRVELEPQVQHGDPGKRWVGDQGMWRLDTSRQKQVFADLALSAELAPGEMVVLTCLPGRHGSLGHSFFTDDSSGEPQQKLLLVRVAQTQHDGLFTPGEPLPLDD